MQAKSINPCRAGFAHSMPGSIVLTLSTFVCAAGRAERGGQEDAPAPQEPLSQWLHGALATRQCEECFLVIWVDLVMTRPWPRILNWKQIIAHQAEMVP